MRTRIRKRMRRRGKIYKFLVVEENEGEKWSQLAAHSHVSTSSQIAAGPYHNDEHDDDDDDDDDDC